MKKTQKKKYTTIAIVAGLVFLFGATFAFADSGNVSFLDRVAQVAGQILGNNITDKLNASGVLDEELTDEIIGGAAGTTFSFHSYFDQGLTAGGYYATSSASLTLTNFTTSATTTFRGTPTTIVWLPSVPTTIQIDATSTMDYVPKIGDMATIHFKNASTTALTGLITFAASVKNDQLDLQDNEDSGDLNLAPLGWMKITFIRTSAYNVTAILDEYLAAD